eukprot:CAMPEP_0113673914 /NCGR_PEP_ID=MMETSP0038_2-20120614/7116_1 /TAXON_ID=2898 /ORGANISM="Cryptomonas paramecium" /LENGTH=331 /DNA_ID=CAMNT_0000590413 /DNA_START=95 /DNA_END=1087 /DNA_ORIENTATION=+ /assembly_acc=CAM_ASM_000170
MTAVTSPATKELNLFCDSVILGDRFVSNSAVVSIRGSQIQKVLEMSRSEMEAKRSSGELSNLEDLGPDVMLCPAFVNTHTHLAMNAMRGVTTARDMAGNVVEDVFFRVEGSLTADDVRAFTRMGCYEAVLAGVGACFDHYYFGEAVAAAMAEVGMSGAVAPTLQDLSGPGLVLGGWEAALEQTLSIHRDPALRDRGIVAALGPHATDTVSPKLWSVIVENAERENIPIHVHVAQSHDEFRRAHDRSGLSPVGILERDGVLGSRASLLLIHAMFLSNQDLDKLSPERHTLGICPSSSVQFGFPCDVAAWRARGLGVAVGTDASCSSDQMNVQ